tara:strand:+ start:192 stop:509 length:318 start_codon:yes stop_codon:yes gene_type:complete
MEKHSAYKSMRLKGNKTTPEGKADLIRWKNEKWVNLTAKITDNKKLPCGTKGKKQKELKLPSICRPSVKINSKTPAPLASSYSTSQIKKAINIKKKGQIINWNKL